MQDEMGGLQSHARIPEMGKTRLQRTIRADVIRWALRAVELERRPDDAVAKGSLPRKLLGSCSTLHPIAIVGAIVTSACFGDHETDWAAAISSEEPAVSAPLVTMRVSRVHDSTTEIFATLRPGLRLEDVVDITLFDGFDPRMTTEQAASLHGAPSGRWLDPHYRVRAHFYDTPNGRISLCRVPSSGLHSWNTVGYPEKCTFEEIFKDARLAQQVLPWLPAYGDVSVSVSQQNGSGGVSVYTTATNCGPLILTAREQ